MRPLVSVVLAVRNEAPFVEEVVRAVLTQDYPQERLEVIVADGMSEDGTRARVQRLAAADPRLRLLDNPRRITPAGVNVGIQAARGDVLVWVSGHAVLPPTYVQECVEHLEAESRKPGAECGPCDLLAVGGAWDCLGRGAMGEAIARATSSVFGVGNALYRTSGASRTPVAVDTVPFWAMRRQVFERLGLFREEMLCHEDYEFNYRFRRAGGQILLLPWLRAKYYSRSTLPDLARQCSRYGFWKGRFLRSHPASWQWRHLVPPLFVAALLAGIAAAFVSRAGAVALAVLLGAYLGFLLLAAFTLSFRPRPAEAGASRLALFALLAGVLATVHLCWGAAVWAGLWRGPVRGPTPPLLPPRREDGEP